MVTLRSAKPPFAGSIPARASRFKIMPVWWNGIHARLKIVSPVRDVGSSPTTGKKKNIRRAA